MSQKIAHHQSAASRKIRSSERLGNDANMGIPPMAAAAIARQRQMTSLPPLEMPPTEICLSPLLWSESFGLLVDG